MGVDVVIGSSPSWIRIRDAVRGRRSRRGRPGCGQASKHASTLIPGGSCGPRAPPAAARVPGVRVLDGGWLEEAARNGDGPALGTTPALAQETPQPGKRPG